MLCVPVHRGKSLTHTQDLCSDSCYQLCMVITLSLIIKTHSHTLTARQASLPTSATRSAWWLRSPQWAACQHSARAATHPEVSSNGKERIWYLDLPAHTLLSVTTSYCWYKALQEASHTASVWLVSSAEALMSHSTHVMEPNDSHLYEFTCSCHLTTQDAI